MAGKSLDRWRTLLPAFWAGGLVTVAAVATPAPFAMLAAADAGRVVARVLAQEAYASLALGVLLLLLERVAARRRDAAGLGSLFSAGMALSLAALFFTVLGYFAIQPLMPAARAGQGAFSFGQLHAASAACYGLKALCVLVLAWRNAALPPGRPAQASGPAAAPVTPASS